MHQRSYPPRPQEKRLRLNNQIRVPEVSVIGDQGEQLGVMPVHEALKLASERGFDLVEVGPTAQPPIAKIMDYGRYMYQKERREKQSPVKNRAQEVKTVKIGFRTEEHDMNVRAQQAAKFLQKGYRVKLELQLRGREKAMAQLGKTKLEHLTKLIVEPYAVETPLRSFPGGWGILLKPSKPNKSA